MYLRLYSHLDRSVTTQSLPCPSSPLLVCCCCCPITNYQNSCFIIHQVSLIVRDPRTRFALVGLLALCDVPVGHEVYRNDKDRFVIVVGMRKNDATRRTFIQRVELLHLVRAQLKVVHIGVLFDTSLLCRFRDRSEALSVSTVSLRV